VSSLFHQTRNGGSQRYHWRPDHYHPST